MRQIINKSALAGILLIIGQICLAGPIKDLESKVLGAQERIVNSQKVFILYTFFVQITQRSVIKITAYIPSSPPFNALFAAMAGQITVSE